MLSFQHLLDIFVFLFSSAYVIFLQYILYWFADDQSHIFVKFVVLKQFFFLFIQTLLVIELFQEIFLGCYFVDRGKS